MARMIPAAVDLDSMPPGERMVFSSLARDEATADWRVLHSFDLPRHQYQLQGEIDFVVIIPDLGVVCVEVKSHRSVERRADGMWVLGSDPPWDKGPFKQASEATFSLLNLVRARAPHLADIPFVSAVCFPRCTFEVPAVEWEEWQVIDERALSQHPLSYQIASVLHHAREKFKRRGAKWLASDAPSEDQVSALAKLLRPRFEVHQSPRARARELTQELRRYTEEQMTILDVCELNDQVFIQGAAGTGKTVLAIEQARRFSLSGDTVLLCCFNRNLADWMRHEFESAESTVSVKTIHSVMLDIVGKAPPANPDQQYWDDHLPSQALAALLEGHPLAGSFASIVVDEGQDILFQPFMDVLDLLLADGLQGGKIVIFADLERQAIYRHGSSEPASVLSTSLPGITRYPLHINCRNTPRIGAFISQLVGGDHLYRAFRRPDDGVEPDIVIWKDSMDQVDRLAQILDGFLQEGFKAEDIAVLSLVSPDVAAATRLEHPWSARLRPMAASLPGLGRTSSIAAFKGLEAPAVVLTDITSLDSAWEESMLYVGMSRAVDRLAMLGSKNAQRDLRSIVFGRTSG